MSAFILCYSITEMPLQSPIPRLCRLPNLCGVTHTQTHTHTHPLTLLWTSLCAFWQKEEGAGDPGPTPDRGERSGLKARWAWRKGEARVEVWVSGLKPRLVQEEGALWCNLLPKHGVHFPPKMLQIYYCMTFTLEHLFPRKSSKGALSSCNPYIEHTMVALYEHTMLRYFAMF